MGWLSPEVKIGVEMQRSGALRNQHRVTFRFFRPEGELWHQLVAFADGTAPLSNYAELFIEAQELALSPVVERWVESAHKERASSTPDP